MENLETLKREIAGCILCASALPLGANPVLMPKSGARILIVGQAPGRRAHETGLPFNDPSGERLRAWMGLTRETFYGHPLIAIVPMGFCYPGTGKSGDLPPRPECARAWRSRLMSCMPEIELVLAIGQYAQAWHLGSRRKKTLTDTVKAWREYLPSGVLPLPHPSPRNTLWLRRNPWLEAEAIPCLRERVAAMLASGPDPSGGSCGRRGA